MLEHIAQSLVLGGLFHPRSRAQHQVNQRVPFLPLVARDDNNGLVGVRSSPIFGWAINSYFCLWLHTDQRSCSPVFNEAIFIGQRAGQQKSRGWPKTAGAGREKRENTDSLAMRNNGNPILLFRRIL